MLLIAALVIGAAVPAWRRIINEKKSDLAANEIAELQRKIDRFGRRHNRYPASWEELDLAIPLDPWGNAYRYRNLRGSGGEPGPVRVDGESRPVNYDYDLYSAGPDAASLPPIGAAESRDDILRARNGDYIGIASDLR